MLIFKALIDSNISHDEFVLINNVLKEFDDIRQEIKNSIVKQKFETIHKTMLSCYLKCRKNSESKNPKIVKAKTGRRMLLSKSVVCDSKILKFIKK